MSSGASLWRVFPWEGKAAMGAPFSPSFVPEPTGRGRFDLPGRLSPVLYLAETPEHAVAELLHPWRGRTLDGRHLSRSGRPLALVEVSLAGATVTSSPRGGLVAEAGGAANPGPAAGSPEPVPSAGEGSGRRVADLCDPTVLERAGIAPDRVASRHRALTQPIARALWDADYVGLRWWSRFWGDWHSTILFTARFGMGGRGDAGRGGGVAPTGAGAGRGRESGLALGWGAPSRLTTSSPALVAAAELLGMEVRR